MTELPENILPDILYVDGRPVPVYTEYQLRDYGRAVVSERDQLRKELAELKEAASMQQNNGAELLGLRKAAQMALEALEKNLTSLAGGVTYNMTTEAMKALRKELGHG